MCYAGFVKTIPQRELRNHSGEILRRAERGQEFVISVGGRPVAELGPCRKRPWVTKGEYLRIFGVGSDDPSFFDDIAGMGQAAPDLDARWSG